MLGIKFPKCRYIVAQNVVEYFVLIILLWHSYALWAKKFLQIVEIIFRKKKLLDLLAYHNFIKKNYIVYNDQKLKYCFTYI